MNFEQMELPQEFNFHKEGSDIPYYAFKEGDGYRVYWKNISGEKVSNFYSSLFVYEKIESGYWKIYQPALEEVMQSRSNDNFIESLDIVLSDLRETLIKKNHDYGDSFSKQYKKYGLTSYLIRDDDKTSRLESLLTKGALVSESTRDTVLDKAGYAVLTLISMDGEKNGD